MLPILLHYCHLFVFLPCRFKFLGSVRKINLDLGVYTATEKMWFYSLHTCGEFLTNEVSNIPFYKQYHALYK